MAYYRLYMIGVANGRFVGFEGIEAADDVEATHLAEAYAGASPMELWCGKRKVRSYHGAGAQPGRAPLST